MLIRRDETETIVQGRPQGLGPRTDFASHGDFACLEDLFLTPDTFDSQAAMETSPMPLQLFTLRDGQVTGQAEQGLVNAYAADFQGLRHFGAKLGEALELGAPWTGTLQEEDLTVNFAYFDAGTSSLDPGAGSMIGERRPLFEMLNRINEIKA
jgi:hypothetical protein